MRSNANERIGDMAEGLVAGLVPMCVIDLFEPVDVHHDKRGVAGCLRCTCEASAGFTMKAATVGETCQVITISKAADFSVEAVVLQVLPDRVAHGQRCDGAGNDDCIGQRDDLELSREVRHGQPDKAGREGN